MRALHMSLCLGIGGLLAACASPPVHLYTLMPPEPAAMAPRVTGRYKVLIQRLDLPESVDRAQLVVRLGPNRLAALEQERWAEPLHEAIPRLVREYLASQLPNASVFLENELPNSHPDITTTLEITRIELLPGQSALIEIRGWLTTGAKTSPVHVVARSTVIGGRNNYDALVGAIVTALASACADLALAIDSAQSGNA